MDKNGIINIDDVTALINYLLTNDGSSFDATTDCDLNGVTSIDDATALINFLLSGTW